MVNTLAFSLAPLLTGYERIIALLFPHKEEIDAKLSTTALKFSPENHVQKTKNMLMLIEVDSLIF